MKSLQVIKDEKEGKIPFCPYQNCAFKCCQFQQGNYIVMYPGEVEEAQERNQSLNHLELTPYHGGYKAICRAKDTSTCDGGYKPLDCQSYPFFPTVKGTSLHINLKGEKCPLTLLHLRTHQIWVKKKWENLILRAPIVSEWIKKVVLVGYIQI